MRVDRVVSPILEKIRCGTRRGFIDTFAMNKRYRVIGGINNTAWKILAICLVYSLLSGLSIDCSIVLFIAYFSFFFVYNLFFFYLKYVYIYIYILYLKCKNFTNHEFSVKRKKITFDLSLSLSRKKKYSHLYKYISNKLYIYIYYLLF